MFVFDLLLPFELDHMLSVLLDALRPPSLGVRLINLCFLSKKEMRQPFLQHAPAIGGISVSRTWGRRKIN
jgi:hypothetical protein